MYAELKATPRGKAYDARFEEWLRAHGIDTHPDSFVGRPRRGIVLIPRALQPHADRVDESVFTFVGSCHDERPEKSARSGAGERPGAGEWRRPAGAEKLLLVSLGSAWTKQPAFYRDCVEAFGGLEGWHVVLQIGKFVDPAELGELPANIEVHSWVPQLAILREADAFVTHAGAGGSQEGLATATPMVAVPQAVDQFGNADMLQSLGVAVHLPKEEVTPERLREAVLTLAADPEVARRAPPDPGGDGAGRRHAEGRRSDRGRAVGFLNPGPRRVS